MRPAARRIDTTHGSRRGLRLFVALAGIAILGHFAQVAHFLSVAHGVGSDGHLHHLCAGRQAEPEPGPEPSPEPDDGDRCPMMPPGLEPCGDPATPQRAPSPAPTPLAEPTGGLAPSSGDVLAIAPKHSPPRRSRS